MAKPSIPQGPTLSAKSFVLTVAILLLADCLSAWAFGQW